MTYINSTHATRRPRRSLITRLIFLRDLWRQRRALKDLDDAALEDIGISRSQAESEARRPIWDAPETWYR